MNESAHAVFVGCNQQNAFSVKADAKQKNTVKEQGRLTVIQPVR